MKQTIRYCHLFGGTCQAQSASVRVTADGTGTDEHDMSLLRISIYGSRLSKSVMISGGHTSLSIIIPGFRKRR